MAVKNSENTTRVYVGGYIYSVQTDSSYGDVFSKTIKFESI